jgi:hypothetical protein
MYGIRLLRTVSMLALLAAASASTLDALRPPNDATRASPNRSSGSSYETSLYLYTSEGRQSPARYEIRIDDDPTTEAKTGG